MGSNKAVPSVRERLPLEAIGVEIGLQSSMLILLENIKGIFGLIEMNKIRVIGNCDAKEIM